MFAHVPPVYCVDVLTLKTYVPTVKLRSGHDVPDTSPPTVIGVVVVTGIDSGVTIDRETGTTVLTTLDGAVGPTVRSVPHATRGSVPSATAPIANAACVLFMALA